MAKVEHGNDSFVEEVETTEAQFGECRVCLQTTNDAGCPLSATVVDSDKEYFLSLQDILSQICVIDVTADDGLPDVVCEECREALMAAYKLQLLAQHSDSVLRQRFTGEDELVVKSRKDVQPMLIVEEQAEEDAEAEENFYEDQGVKEESFADPSEEDELVESLEAGQVPSEDVKPGHKYSVCSVCGKQFTNVQHLTRHKKLHAVDPNRPYQCTVCYKRFHIDSTLKLHMMLHEAQAPTPLVFQCEQCGDEFKTKAKFNKHWKMHEEEAGGEPMQEDGEEGDENTAAGDDDVVRVEYEVEEEEQKPDVLSLKLPKKTYKCQFCEKVYQSINVLGSHTKSVHPEKALHECGICGHSYPLQSLLMEHLELHEGVKRYACTICDKRYRVSSNLKDHLRTHTEERTFLCNSCGKGFQTRNNLRQHMARHSSEKKYACDMCPSKFVTKASLTTHRRTHTGDRPYQCPHCEATFASHFSWSKHKRIHTGEKPYVCEICGMRFNSSYHVTVSGHRRICFGRDSNCSLLSFQRHLRTHTGDKPYKCNFCDRAFAQSNDLVKHKRSHLGKNTYQCKECPETFRLNSELRVHISQHYLEAKQRRLEEVGEEEEGVVVGDEGEEGDVVVQEIEIA